LAEQPYLPHASYFRKCVRSSVLSWPDGESALEVSEELRLRDEQTECEAIESDFAKVRRKQTGRGGLLNFVRYFGHTLEPKTRPIVEGWVLEAICMHLEAITFRLLISSSQIAARRGHRSPEKPGVNGAPASV
jgi:hypothetical protein